MDGLSLMRCHGKEESERASKGAATTTTTSSRFHAFHSKDILEKPASSAREEFAFHLSRHHLRAWAAFLRRCLKVAGAVSLQYPPSLPGLPLCDSTPSQVLNDC